ncbi:unnamed protein product [Nippostrongylus brasiliensis]|uniref:Ragulator complex protein LAMTOR1 n=1 Tax=Nippostrongylus brasiliensis TaxID=27835 RepID=A0A0N4YP29_NIPBR|nr:unnamed protein product [Nippostrongylus brasiliensis]
MDIMKTICCCGGEDDDGMPYERFYDESSVTPIRREGSRLNGRGVDEPDNGSWDATRKTAKSKEEQEEEALNRILENTQHNIIDVSHLDGMTLNTAEYLARAQQYEEAIRTHDQNASRGANGVTRSPSRPGKRLLEDTGNKVADWLGRPGPSRDSYAEIQRLTAEMHEAVNQGFQVQHKTDLVVYMDL